MSASSHPRRNVSNACQNCRTRNEPCEACVQLGVDCVYEIEDDGRRLRAQKTKVQELQRDQQLLDGLLTKIRDSEDTEVRKVVALIRRNATLEEIKTSVKQQLLDQRMSGQESSPELEALQSELEQISSEVTPLDPSADRRDVLSIHRLTSDPLYKVPASPWTTVTADNELVSHLISTWLVHDKSWYDWVDESLFLNAMAAADLNTKYCSPFLVNTILAWSCPYSDWAEARTRKGAHSPLSTKFTEEAKRLLEDEVSAGSSLTLAQGLLFLGYTISVHGEDRLGYHYVAQSISVLQDLTKAYPTSRQSNTDGPDKKTFAMAIDHVVWGIFNCTTASYLAWMKPQLMHAPLRNRPVFSTPVTGALTQEQHSSLVTLNRELFLVQCDISPIVAEMTKALFGDDTNQLSREETLEDVILRKHEEFLNTIAVMPFHLKLTPTASATVYTHHLCYEAVTLRVMMMALQSLREQATTPDNARRMENACLEAAIRVAEMCRMCMNEHKILAMNVSTCQPCLLALLVLLENSIRGVNHGEQILTLVTFLRRQSRRWPIAMAFLRMAQMHAKARAIALPPDVERLFDDFETQQWNERSRTRFTSILPDPSRIFNMDAGLDDEFLDMGKFLERMEEMTLQDALAKN